jgi:3-oxoacyl-[acyl-carrier-protein] synthase III
MKNIPIAITGLGMALPSQVLENEYFETLHKVAEGTIEAHLGIKTRRHSVDETQTALAARALQEALNHANYQFEDLDLLIHASVSFAYVLPNTATMIQCEMGKQNSGIPCMDVNMSCLSWLSAFEMAAGLLQTGRYRRIAIVSAEQPSKILNINNLETHALFGDAAAATIIELPKQGNQGILKSKFQTYSDGWDLSIVPGGGLVKSPLHHEMACEDYTFQMDNRRLLLYSLKKLKTFFSEFIDDTTTWESIDKIVPHQASRAGLDFFTNHYQLGEKVVRNIEHRGNCVAASIPLALCEHHKNGNIKRGDCVLLIGTAAGISIGGILIEF